MSTIFTGQISSLYTTDPYRVGVDVLPYGIASVVGMLGAGLFMRKIRYTNLQLAVICFILTIFVGVMATLTPKTVKPGLAFTCLGGFAGGWVMILLVVMVQFGSPDRLIGTSTGLLNFARTVGQALGSKSQKGSVLYGCD
jgi:predicted MFS family arabinose efflux permease